MAGIRGTTKAAATTSAPQRYQPPGPLRRTPSQERSATRVSRMLDAAGSLVAEIGYDATTTTLIAERAKVSVGSLYQFFPDRQAVVRALTQRNMETFVGRVGELFAAREFANWWDAVDAIVDAFVEMARTTPGFSVLKFGDVVDEHLLDGETPNDDVLARQLGGLLASAFGVAYEEELDLALAIVIKVGEALLDLAFRRVPQGDPVVIEAAKSMIHGHLSSYFDPAGE